MNNRKKMYLDSLYLKIYFPPTIAVNVIRDQILDSDRNPFSI